MEFDNTLYKAFLEAMNDLDNFRVAYAADHPGLSLDREDPDVRRLIEAMAFFSARTHVAGAKNITAARLRLFQQVFSFLLSPIPSMGIIQGDVTGQFQEKAFFPRGTEFLFSTLAGDSALYRTMENLSVLPAKLTNARLIPLPSKGYRLMITFRSMYRRTDTIGRISLYMDYLGDYQNSLYLMDSLERSMTSAFITFEERVDETTRAEKGSVCRVGFGPGTEKTAKAATEPLMHPIQESRFFFHFPSQGLYMHIDVPEAERAWKQFTLCLDLNGNWPSKLVINKDMFNPYSVPVENLKRASAEPAIYDGTKERVAVRHPEMDARYELQEIIGVYKVQDGVTSSLRPGILAGDGGTYEIEYRQAGGKTLHSINLHYPEAFADPVTLVVDAQWIQPDFSEKLGGKIAVKPYSRHIPGLKWHKTDNMLGHAANAFHEDMDLFLYLLSLRHKNRFDYDDILSLLQVQGSVFKGVFRQVKELFTGIRVQEAKVRSASGSSLKYIYHLQFKACPDFVRPMVRTFARQVGKMLDCWMSQAVVETRIEFHEP